MDKPKEPRPLSQIGEDLEKITTELLHRPCLRANYSQAIYPFGSCVREQEVKKRTFPNYVVDEMCPECRAYWYTSQAQFHIKKCAILEEERSEKPKNTGW